jgi:hypothetical protein
MPGRHFDTMDTRDAQIYDFGRYKVCSQSIFIVIALGGAAFYIVSVSESMTKLDFVTFGCSPVSLS